MLFEDRSELLDRLAILRTHKLVFDTAGTLMPSCSLNDEEYFYGEIMEAFECLGMEIYTECEGYDTTIIFFNFPDMNEYYDLCRKYAKRKQVNFRKCDRVLAAEHYVDAEMRWIHTYSYNWGLFVPKKLVKKRSYRLCVELAVDFDSYSELLESLCNIHRYYSDMTAELRRELNAPVSLTVLPPRQQEERSAA